MYKHLLLGFLMLFGSNALLAQKTYFTSQGESIFSLANYNGPSSKNILRFSSFPNSEIVLNKDFDGYGTFIGGGLRNMGFIWEDSIKHKRRALGISIPAALKLGNVAEDRYFTFGAELDLYFHFKQKDWIDGKKVKQRSFFNEEINPVSPILAVGYNYKMTYIRLKYHLFDFYNTKYSYMENGVEIFPYKGITSKMFYLSITFRNVLFGGKDRFSTDDAASAP